MRGLAIRTRLTLVFATLSVALVGAAAVALVLGFRAVLLGTVDDRLRTRFAELVDDPRAVASSRASEEEFAQFVESDGSLVAGPGPTERLLPPDVTSGVDRASLLLHRRGRGDAGGGRADPDPRRAGRRVEC